MNPPRILVFGYSDVGHACLRALIKKKAAVVGLYTHEDKPDEQLWFPSAALLAQENNIPVFTSQDLKAEEVRGNILSLHPDLIFSFYYRHLIPHDILSIPSLGAFNMHGSLLPKYRGRAPVNWAVLNGESKTGATLHEMVEKPDAGAIVDQQAVPIDPNDTALTVQKRVTKAAVNIITRQLKNLLAGKAPRKTQNEAQASYFGRRKPADGFIFWHQPAKDVHNLIRAVTHPYPGAFTDIFDSKTYIWASRISKETKINPGEWKRVKNRMLIGCGKGAIEVLRIQKEGEAEMPAVKFARRNQ